MCPRACSFPLFFDSRLFFFFGEDGSSFSSLIMPNSGPICHVYSAGTKQRGEPRLCPLPRAPTPLHPSPNHYRSTSYPTHTCNIWISRFVKRNILTPGIQSPYPSVRPYSTLTSNITSGMIQNDTRQLFCLAVLIITVGISVLFNDK